MNKKQLTVSVIITTYNQPDYLYLVLIALLAQDTKNFEIIIADDGSDEKTKKLIETIQTKTTIPIKHVWQKHDNFQAATIRNKAAITANGDYIIFLDGDSIPTKSFISSHKKLAKNGYFVAGNRILVSQNFTNKILSKKILLHEWSRWGLLQAFCSRWINRLSPTLYLGNIYCRYLHPTKWQGAKTCNLGLWKKDFIAINGFDESYNGWGYEDSDLVIRLIHNKIWRKSGHFAVHVFHLWHPINDRTQESINYQKLKNVINSSKIKASLGIDRYFK